MFPELDRLDNWKAYKKGMCDGCWSACCTLPVEVSVKDLMRLGLATEDEAAVSLKKLAKKLMKERWIQGFSAKTGIFVLSQISGRDCVFLDRNRRCTVYEKRPEVCRAFPKIGPKPGFCPARKIKSTVQFSDG